MASSALGFLMIVFLIPGAYALECYTFTSFRQFDSKGRCGFERSTVGHNSTCSSGYDSCIDAQLELSTDANTLLVNHRGCFTKDATHAEGTMSFGHRFFAIRFNLSCCHSDFCNVRTVSAEVPKAIREDTEASHSSGSIRCYSGQNHNASELTLEKVSCSHSSASCYQGSHTITVGNITQAFYIRSCQNLSCDVVKHRVFGPIEINLVDGFCCTGSYCNEKNDTSKVANGTISGPSNASSGESAGNPTISSTSSDVGNDYNEEDTDYDINETGDEEPSDTSLNPRGRNPRAKGSSLQFCPLLLAVAITVLEPGWW